MPYYTNAVNPKERKQNWKKKLYYKNNKNI